MKIITRSCLLAVIVYVSVVSVVAGELSVGRVIRQITEHEDDFVNEAIFEPAVNCPACLPLVMCPMVTQQAVRTCALPDAQLGVCCPARPQPLGVTGAELLFSEELRDQEVPMRDIPPEELRDACSRGIRAVSNTSKLELELVRSNMVLEPDSPAYRHLKIFQVTDTARTVNTEAQVVMHASKELVNRLGLSSAQGTHSLRRVLVKRSILSSMCPAPPPCDPFTRYRSVDGSCNNLRYPLRGKRETALQRILPPHYHDGISAPRSRSVIGSLLPEARMISNSVIGEATVNDQEFTLSVMQWGQFLDHDVTHVPFPTMHVDGHGIECCSSDGLEVTEPFRHHNCMPIRVPRDDHFFSSRGIQCMNFVRSMLAVNDGCTFGPAEQMNQLTHWLDGSNIYGSNEEEAERLRLRRGGLLRVSERNFLPTADETSGACEAVIKKGHCYVAGDSRVNEQPGLTVIHAVFHREHNRVASSLQILNPHWQDEIIYQEARRIVVAEYQHITYNEWLPIIVGDKFMDSYGLRPLQSGHSYDYNPEINANIYNEFSTAAFRFGHSLVQGFVSVFPGVESGGTPLGIQLRNHFSSPHVFSQDPEAYDRLIVALTREAIGKFDNLVSDDLVNHLFQTPAHDFGLDLVSLNIQRGRDHAIPPYNDMREVCGLPRAKDFADLRDMIHPDIIRAMEDIYDHVDDIDFFAGGMSESPVSGGILGWTFLCVVGDQFARIKKGDRYFYELGAMPGSFSEAQLDAIRRASYARILCDNSDAVGELQPLAFRQPHSTLNPIVSCFGSAIPTVDLTAWKENSPVFI